MKEAIGKKIPPSIPQIIQPSKPQILEKKAEQEPKQVEIQWEEVPIITSEKMAETETQNELFSEKTFNNWTIKELRDYCDEHNIYIPSKANKAEIIKIIQEFFTQKALKEVSAVVGEEEREKAEPVISTIAKPKKEMAKLKSPEKLLKPKLEQTTLPIITTERILEVLSDDWQNITHLIFKLKIKDMMDARYLQNKLKTLVRKEKVIVEIKKGKKHWKLK
jgi:hypothetical protein